MKWTRKAAWQRPEWSSSICSAIGQARALHVAPEIPERFRSRHTRIGFPRGTILSGIFGNRYGEKFDAANLKILRPAVLYRAANIPHYIEIKEDARTAGERHGSERAHICQSSDSPK